MTKRYIVVIALGEHPVINGIERRIMNLAEEGKLVHALVFRGEASIYEELRGKVAKAVMVAIKGG
ncbi:hypothetical protein J7L13_01650 [bacterium]|nr:hypothetical protein [bacterium]